MGYKPEIITFTDAEKSHLEEFYWFWMLEKYVVERRIVMTIYSPNQNKLEFLKMERIIDLTPLQTIFVIDTQCVKGSFLVQK